MTIACAALAALFLASPALADDKPPASALPGLAQPAAEAPKAKAEAKAEAFVPVGAAAPYKVVVDGYGQARDQFETWLIDASGQAKALHERETALKAEIEQKEGEITKLKFQSSKDAKKQSKALAQETKQLWKDLKKLGGEKAALKKSLAKSASLKFRELNAAVSSSLDEAQKAE